MDAKTDAKLHWVYTGAVIRKAGTTLDSDVLALCEFLYVEAFRHGAKHQQQGDYNDTEEAT